MATERRVQGAGLSLFVTERGDPARSTVVLVHGFPDTSAVWTPVAERLAADFHVVTYDVRGAGRSDIPADRSAYGLPALVEDLASVVDATSPGAPVHLVAHDWGSIQGWEAVTTPGISGRFRSYTSISGPPIDHAALWARRHTRPGADLWKALRQSLHSWYIAWFHVPLLPELMFRGSRAPALWAAALHRVERVPTDADWPSASFGADFAHGVNLYRTNIGARMRHPQQRHTDVPVQLVVPTRDRYVTPPLLEGLEQWSDRTWKRVIDAGHWVIRTDPDRIAAFVGDVASYVEGGPESLSLRQSEVA